MKNQYSFRLTTTLLPTDTSAKTTQVINKTDSSGNKFYPNFTEETVVLTNDDRTIIETTRATCNNWTLTFVKRGLSDDDTETQIANRKLTWNPWTLCFITAWASDYIDPDDDRIWQWDQTYLWKALYKWALETEKWVKYPHFDSLEDLQDYWTPFGWMFAVVDSDWELYRYNDVEEEWAVVTTSTPVQPAKANTTAVGTVRVATDTEFNNGTDQWSNDEYLMATVSQIKANVPEVAVDVLTITSESDLVWWQAVLDKFLWWWCPIINYTWQTYPQLFYLDAINTWSNRIAFRHIWLSMESDATWSYAWQYWIRIRYSWTTITSIWLNVDKFYVNWYE